MKLEEIVTVRLGRNLSRRNEKISARIKVYSYENLTMDLNGLYLGSDCEKNSNKINDNYYLTSNGEVVFSFVSSTAGIVSKENSGKLLNQNFAKLIIETEELDPSYLCYALNESLSIKKQMAVSMQGSTIPKLTPSILKKIDLKLPSIATQKVIGKAYLMLCKKEALTIEESALEKVYGLQLLQKINEKKSGE